MCLIIHKPANAKFDTELLEIAQENNPNGVGFMFATSQKTVFAVKGLWTKERVKEFWTKYQHKELVVHFRLATKGRKDQENCHPFQVLNYAEHGRDLWMVHNGTFKNYPDKERNKSDTYNFVHYALKPYLVDRPYLIDSEEFQDFLQEKIGSWNKLVFMDGKGKVIIINENAGHYMDNCWLSNTYSIKKRVKSYGYFDGYGDDYDHPFYVEQRPYQW